MPTASEGKELKNFAYKIWSGFMVPKNTPEEMVQKLHKAIGAALKDPGVRTQLAARSCGRHQRKSPCKSLTRKGF
ncbi:tripartite tricarboxylate transporter substrate-binding protein [Variovorax sp. 2RAF20]